MPIELAYVHRDQKGSTRLLEPVLERIWQFSTRFEGDADALVNAVWKCFAERSTAMGLWAVLDGETIIAHALVFVKEWDGQWVAWVTQLEIDRPITNAFRQHALATLDEWVRNTNVVLKPQGIVIADILMSTPHMSDAWGRGYGFEQYRQVRRRRVR